MKPDKEKSIWLSDAAANSAAISSHPKTLGDALTHAAQAWPDRDAVVYACQPSIGDIRWSYHELNELAEKLARSLLSFGYRTGDRIAVWGPNHAEWILLEYAFAKAGLVIVALNPLYKESELAFALNASEVVGLFHSATVGGVELYDIVKKVRHLTPALRWVHSFTDGVNNFLETESKVSLPENITADSLFMIQYTSGTTGSPKAAQLSHGAIATTAFNSYRRWGFGENSRVCHGFPLFHVGGSGNSVPGAALNGGTTLPLYIFHPERTLDILEKEKCTGFIGVPTMLTAMLEDPSFESRDLSSLEVIVTGGAQVHSHLLKQSEAAFGVQVLNCYGQTETCGVTTSTKASDSSQIKSTSSGQPLSHVSVKIVDSNGHVLPHNQEGELCYLGSGKMIGYRDLKANMTAFDDEGWLRSGDLGRMDLQGNVSIVGRSKEIIIRGGENLSPAEIENYLLQHDDIAAAVVIGLPDPKYGEEVCAVLRTTNKNHATPDEIREWCKVKVSKWKVPKYITFIDEFPTTPSGKVKKYILQDTMIQHFELK